MNNPPLEKPTSPVEESRSLLIAKYPVRLLHYAELGVILGCLLVLGIHSIEKKSPRWDRIVWEERVPEPAPITPSNPGEGENPDRDGDGIPNEWETTHSHNPDFAADAASDFDNDGLTTLQEYQLWLRTSGQAGKPLGKWQAKEIPIGQLPFDTSKFVNFYQYGGVTAANDRGDILLGFQIEGETTNGEWEESQHAAFLMTDGSMKEIQIPGKTSGFTHASDINEQGEVLLQWYSEDGTGHESYFLKSDNSVTQITLDGNPCFAYRINNFSDWVGYEITENQGWQPVHVVDGMPMPKHQSLTTFGFNDINDYGQIIGYYFDLVENRPITFTQLGSQFFSTGQNGGLPRFDESSFQWQWPAAINNWGEFTGGVNEVGWRENAFFFDGSYKLISGPDNASRSWPVDLSKNGMVLFGAASGDYGIAKPYLWRDSVTVACDALFPEAPWNSDGGYIDANKLTSQGKIFYTRYDAYNLPASILILTPDQDSDGDGMPDDWEEFYGFNPNLNDANLDSDGDGTNNLGEFLLRSDPHAAPDIDSDGEPIDTRPGVDTDGDGIPNNWEVVNGMNYEDPADAALDFDRDGYSNLQEFRLSTDPRGAPAYRIRQIGPFTGVYGVDISRATLSDGAISVGSDNFGGVQGTEEVFFTASISPSQSGPVMWSQPRTDDDGVLSFYPSATEEPRNLVAHSPSGAVITCNDTYPKVFTYWSSPNADPVTLTAIDNDIFICDLYYATLSPSGKYLFAIRQNSLGIFEPIAWKMPSSDNIMYQPIVITAPEGASIETWLTAHINDYGIITANGLVNGQTRGLVWTMDEYGNSLEGTILPNLSGDNYSYVVGISNHSAPIIAGTSFNSENQERATVWKYTGPTSCILSDLGILPNGNASQIVKISPNGTLAGVANTLHENELKQHVICAVPVIPSSSDSIDPTLYHLTPQGESFGNGASISHVTNAGEIIAQIYNASYVPELYLLSHGKSHSLESSIPPASGYELQEIIGINAQGSLLVTALKDHSLERILLTPDRDTDGDGLPDAWENANQFNPFSKNNSHADTESDGLTDLLEFANGTHPRIPDTDGDGMKDGWEVEWGFLPLDATDALLDPDEDRVNNLRESQIGTIPTGVYKVDIRYIDTEWQYPQILGAGDDGGIIRTGASTTNYSSDGDEYSYEYCQDIFALAPVASNGTSQLPSNRYSFRYNGDWTKYSGLNSWGNYYVDAASGQINGDRSFYHYQWDSSTSENIYEEAYYLTPDITNFLNESDWISLETVENNLRNPDLHNGSPPLSDSESLIRNAACVSPSGIRRLYRSSDWSKQLLLNERGEFVEHLSNDLNWQMINDQGLAACIVINEGLETAYSTYSYLPWLFLSDGQSLLLPHDPSSPIFPDWALLSYSNDGKILLRNYYQNEQFTSAYRFFLYDSTTGRLDRIRMPASDYSSVSSLSNQNGRMLIQGSKPCQITPDGTCIRLHALRVTDENHGTPVPLKDLYPNVITPSHISSEGCITFSTTNVSGQQQIMQLLLNNDANSNGMSDDWETSEIHFLVSSDSSLWSHLLDVGKLDSETSYWGDGWNAQQSFNLGFTENQLELSKTKDSDYDKVPDNEDADPLDWVVDWKPAIEAAYAVISLDQLNYVGMPIIDSNDPYAEFTASIGDTGTILWNDKIKEVSSDGQESWIDRCRVWKSGNWSADIRDVPNTFSSITLSGIYRPDPMSNPPIFEVMTGTAVPLSPPMNRAFMKPTAVCGESIVGDGSYVGVVTNLKRIVRSYDDDGNEIVETFLDGSRHIYSPNVSSIWSQSNDTHPNWQTKPIGSPPSIDSYGIKPLDLCYDEWEAVFYRAVASPSGAVAVLGGNHLFPSRRWQIWQASNTPGQGPVLWETPYRTEDSQLLIKAVNDEGIAVGERITSTETFWGHSDSVVIERGVETFLPESSGAFTLGASICRINKDEPNSNSRLVVGGSNLWVQKNNTWFQAEHPPTMASIIAIAKNGVMLGSRTIWRNGTSIPLDELVKDLKISETNPAPRYTNLRAYAMNGEGAIVALADDANTPSPNQNGKTLLLLNPVEVCELFPKLLDEDNVEIKGSELPARAPRSTEMVERDPAASLDDASEIRIAWRDMKVKVGKHLVGKKVTWTMTPMFIPQKEDGTAENVAKYRGKWGTADKPEHRVAFSKSEKFGDHGWNQEHPTIDSTPDKNAIAGSASTTVDNKGYTAIRVNLPPIGFNKARINAKIETAQGKVNLIDLEVPGVIVIDPGHGKGNAPPSNAIGTTGVISKVTEHEAVFDIGTRMLESLKQKREINQSKLKIYITRKDSMNIDFRKRTDIARKHGCDVYVSLHFNGEKNSPLYRNPFGMWDVTDNLNEDEDRKLAIRLRKAVQDAISDIQPESLKVPISPYSSEYWENHPKIQKGLDTCSDRQIVNINDIPVEVPYNGNVPGYTPCRAALIELEWLSNENADSLFNGATAKIMRQAAAAEMAEAAIQDIRTQPAQSAQPE